MRGLKVAMVLTAAKKVREFSSAHIPRAPLSLNGVHMKPQKYASKSRAWVQTFCGLPDVHVGQDWLNPRDLKHSFPWLRHIARESALQLQALAARILLQGKLGSPEP